MPVKFEQTQPTGRVEYITPKWFFDQMGLFDLDPCAAKVMPWKTAKKSYTERGLERLWSGCVWLNPPYGIKNGEYDFVRKLVKHGNGVALLGLKTGSKIWQDEVLPNCSGLIFLKGRVVFCNTDGSSTSGYYGYHALTSFGQGGLAKLKRINNEKGVLMCR